MVTKRTSRSQSKSKSKSKSKTKDKAKKEKRHPIEAELLKATKTNSRRSKESVEDYMTRLVGGINDLEDDAWENLTEDTQAWVNAAIEAYNAEEEVPAFDADLSDDDDANDDDDTDDDDTDDDDDDDDEEDDDTDDEEDDDTDDDDDDTDDDDDDEEDDEEESKPPKKRGALKRIKELIVGDMDLTSEEIGDQLSEEGFDSAKSTIDTTMYDVRNTVAILEKAGMLKEGVLKRKSKKGKGKDKSTAAPAKSKGRSRSTPSTTRSKPSRAKGKSKGKATTAPRRQKRK